MLIQTTRNKMPRIEINKGNNPHIACLRCGRRLSLFETIYFDTKYCTKCTNAPREGN